MATITETSYKKDINIPKVGWSEKFWEEAKFNYFGIIGMCILISSIWGGLTAMVILENNAPIWVLCINIYITMASNVASIGQAPIKWVVNLFGLAMLVNLLIVLFYAL